MTTTPAEDPERAVPQDIYDVVLIGGGIMSATLGAMIRKVCPQWSIVLFERLDQFAAESSHPWNNAGTGHSGLCELNYMPDPRDPATAERIGAAFHASRQFWARLVTDGDIDSAFITPVPHMDFVIGERDVAYLRRRYRTLRSIPLFEAMRYTEDPAVIAEWAPLVMAGRDPAEPVAATRYEAGTDIDFGALTTALIATMTAAGARVELGHEVTALRRGADGIWTVEVRDRKAARGRTVRSRFVFVGAGGYALRLLQKAGIDQTRGYGVLPFGAQFLRTDNPEVVARHADKVYSQAALGAPPMSVPHLDKRVVDGRESLLFGPYATFSTRLLKYGRRTDLFTTVNANNIGTLLSAILHNLPLVWYLLTQVVATRRRKLAQLRHFYPGAQPRDWYPVEAGQRAQIVKPGSGRRGDIAFGTELVTGADGTIAGLLGASPGASTAPAILADVFTRCFPELGTPWPTTVLEMMPALGTVEGMNHAEVQTSLLRTAHDLDLS